MSLCVIVYVSLCEGGCESEKERVCVRERQKEERESTLMQRSTLNVSQKLFILVFESPGTGLAM